MSDYTVLDWLAWGVVYIFFGAIIFALGAGAVNALGWGVIPIILGFAVVCWAIQRVMELV